MKMDQGVDTGAILDQRAIRIEDNDSAGSLSEKLSRLGADLLIETLPRSLSGELQPQSQDEGRATYAPMLKRRRPARFHKAGSRTGSTCARVQSVAGRVLREEWRNVEDSPRGRGGGTRVRRAEAGLSGSACGRRARRASYLG